MYRLAQSALTRQKVSPHSVPKTDGIYRVKASMDPFTSESRIEPLVRVLQEIDKGSTPQYGAIVFDDDVGAQITDAFQLGLNVTTQPGDPSPGNATMIAYRLYAKLLGATPEGRCGLTSL